jgi:alanine racemase
MMNMMILDVTDVPGVQLGDRVTLLGGDGRIRIAVEDAADRAQTIHYEFVTRINPLLPRVYT